MSCSECLPTRLNPLAEDLFLPGIVAMASGRDLIAQAQSGTGKSGCFIIGTLQQLDPTDPAPQCIMLSNTRELADQTHKTTASIGDRLGVQAAKFVGGTRVSDDRALLRTGRAQVVCGTPGRVLHLIKDGALYTNKIRVFVIDEADEMLGGFTDALYELFRVLPEAAQVALFSATLPPAALELTTRFMRDPTRILVEKEKLALEGIQQYYVDVKREEWKLDTLLDLYEVIAVAQTMIFVANRRKADWLADQLGAAGHTCSVIHGELEQAERETRMREFRSGSSRMLIATDVLGRGIDVYTVSLVVNFDLPREPEPYLHRIGRSGRHGRKGSAISLITEQDVPGLRAIEQHFQTEVAELPTDIADRL